MIQSYDTIMYNIEQAAAKRGVAASDITVIAATKTQAPQRLTEFARHGLIYGENRVQEFIEKYPLVKGVKWHFIGRLQTNKVKYIIDKVELIHSVDRFSLAKEINARAMSVSKLQDVLLEINLGGEQTKGGVPPEDLNRLIEELSVLENVRIKGLMTVMPLCPTGFDCYERAAEIFERCKLKYKSIDWRYLSMGMSNDYIQAIEKGSNMVRLGRAFFGDRV